MSTITEIPEITTGTVMAHMEATGQTDSMDAYNELTIGVTFLRDRQEPNQFGGERVTLQHRWDTGRHIDIRMEGPTRRNPEGCVNWPGWGDQTADVAVVFAQMLAAAAEIVPTLAPQTERRA